VLRGIPAEAVSVAGPGRSARGLMATAHRPVNRMSHGNRGDAGGKQSAGDARADRPPAVDPAHIATRLRAQRLCRPGRCAAFALG
jgi:hypothetical protein